MLQVYGWVRVGCLLWFSTYDRYCVGFTVVCCGALVVDDFVLFCFGCTVVIVAWFILDGYVVLFPWVFALRVWVVLCGTGLIVWFLVGGWLLLGCCIGLVFDLACCRYLLG